MRDFYFFLIKTQYTFTNRILFHIIFSLHLFRITHKPQSFYTLLFCTAYITKYVIIFQPNILLLPLNDTVLVESISWCVLHRLHMHYLLLTPFLIVSSFRKLFCFKM